jgi:hypothetical protein
MRDIKEIVTPQNMRNVLKRDTAYTELERALAYIMYMSYYHESQPDFSAERMSKKLRAQLRELGFKVYWMGYPVNKYYVTSSEENKTRLGIPLEYLKDHDEPQTQWSKIKR